MIRIASTVFGVALLAAPAFAQQSAQQPQQQQQQQQQGQQQTQQMRQGEQPSQMTGTVKKLGDKEVTLDVAGQDVKVQVDKQQVEGLQEGQRVQVTAVPFPEAQSIEPAQGKKDSKYMLGTVQQKQQDSVTLKTQDNKTVDVKVDPKQAQNIQQGQQVIVELKEARNQASQWKAKQVKPM